MNNNHQETAAPQADQAVRSPQRFKGEILRRVYRVWLFRRLLPVLAAEIIIFSLVIYKLGQAVFVQRILENATQSFFAHPSGIFSFFFAAFVHAGLLIKALSIVGAILAALVVRHVTQGVLRLILVRQNYFSRVPHSVHS